MTTSMTVDVLSVGLVVILLVAIPAFLALFLPFGMTVTSGIGILKIVSVIYVLFSASVVLQGRLRNEPES